MIVPKLRHSKQSTVAGSGCTRRLTVKPARAVIQSHRQQILQGARNDNARLNDEARVLEQQVEHGVHIRYTQLGV